MKQNPFTFSIPRPLCDLAAYLRPSSTSGQLSSRAPFMHSRRKASSRSLSFSVKCPRPRGFVCVKLLDCPLSSFVACHRMRTLIFVPSKKLSSAHADFSTSCSLHSSSFFTSVSFRVFGSMIHYKKSELF